MSSFMFKWIHSGLNDSSTIGGSVPETYECELVINLHQVLDLVLL